MAGANDDISYSGFIYAYKYARTWRQKLYACYYLNDKHEEALQIALAHYDSLEFNDTINYNLLMLNELESKILGFNTSHSSYRKEMFLYKGHRYSSHAILSMFSNQHWEQGYAFYHKYKRLSLLTKTNNEDKNYYAQLLARYGEVCLNTKRLPEAMSIYSNLFNSSFPYKDKYAFGLAQCYEMGKKNSQAIYYYKWFIRDRLNNNAKEKRKTLNLNGSIKKIIRMDSSNIRMIYALDKIEELEKQSVK